MGNKVKRHNIEATANNRLLTIIVFSLFFSWLLAVPFEGQVLYAITEYHGVPTRTIEYGTMD